jgi:outer membrane protein assembly factor BamE (lipoprotein component of BamABCDE complex)
MKKIVVAAMVAVLLAGCASSGNKKLQKETEVSMQNKIKEGVTTKAEVKLAFGSPDGVTFTDGGNEVWKYAFARAKVSGKAFIPFYGLFNNTVTGTKKELVILFDGNKVSKYSMSESEINSRSGLASD